MDEINIYCDESCHLENDGNKSMVIGGVWCSKNDKAYILSRIKEIKKEHGFSPEFEFKWNKVSQSKIEFYKDIVNFFFDTDKLNFRAVVIPDKSILKHEDFHQTHDDFYYKMYFDMLKIIIFPKNRYNIYLDMKDTRGYEKVDKLKTIISNEKYDFSRQIIRNIQEVRSEQVIILQITDLLIGALSYFHRGLHGSKSKLLLIDLIKRRSGYSLSQNTLPSEKKFNIFIWKPGYGRGHKNGSF